MKRNKLEIYDKFYKDPVIRNGFIGGFILLIIDVGLLAWYYQLMPPVIPLFYSLTRGAQQLAEKPFVVILPIMTAVFLLTHMILAWLNYTHDMVFARVMGLSASVVSFIFTVAVIHVIYLVI